MASVQSEGATTGPGFLNSTEPCVLMSNHFRPQLVVVPSQLLVT